MTTWLLSDTHFGHTNLLQYQPERLTLLGLPVGAPIEDHDEALMTHLNSIISPLDQVWFFGDLSMGKRALTVPFTGKLHGVKSVWAPGNHDNGLWSRNKHVDQRDWWRAAGWDLAFERRSNPLYGQHAIAGRQVTFSHLPLHGTPDHESTEVRYEELMLRDNGAFHIHGHSHGHNGRIHGPQDRQFDVGLDGNDLNPTSYDEIQDWIKGAS